MTKPKNAVLLIISGMRYKIWAMRADMVGIFDNIGKSKIVDLSAWRKEFGVLTDANHGLLPEQITDMAADKFFGRHTTHAKNR